MTHQIQLMSLQVVSIEDAKALTLEQIEKCGDRTYFLAKCKYADIFSWKIVSYYKREDSWEYNYGACYGDTIKDAEILELYKLPQPLL
jgi:hypothetical protein